MSLSVLLDQGLPRSTAEHLRQAGIDAVHTGEISMATADDASILQRARQEGRLVVTLDADFHRLMALAGATQPSVIRIRIEGLRGDALARLIEHALQVWKDDLISGALVSVQDRGMRLRRLPLPRP
jgi:predicted nuclease of predicted toxin-antitoxin system